jgi:hypothetical protein
MSLGLSITTTGRCGADLLRVPIGYLIFVLSRGFLHNAVPMVACDVELVVVDKSSIKKAPEIHNCPQNRR